MIGSDPLPNVPTMLKEIPSWVLWRMEKREKGDGTIQDTKVPYCPTTGARAKSDDPTTWTTYRTAAAAFVAQKFSSNGLGFVFSSDRGIVGVDLDKCADPETGELEPWAADVVSSLNSYTEFSPSCRGVHVIVQATMPPGGNRKGRVEIYGHGRYFTVTGLQISDGVGIEPRQAELEAVHGLWVYREEPKPVTVRPSSPSSAATLDDRQLVDRAMKARNGQKFTMLYNGNWEAAGFTSQSDADLSFLDSLAFWTGGDAARMDAIFRQSGLYRQKWERDTYRLPTIQKALARTR